MAQPPRRRGAPEPSNPSRGAGQAAQASAAATAPPSSSALASAAAANEPVTTGFYAPDAPPPESPHAAEPSHNAFTDAVMRDHASLGERLGSADVEVVERAAAEAISSPDDLAAEIARIRSFRKPLGAYSQKLALAARAGYHRHWFNDVAGRIEEASNNGWAHVRGNDGKPIARCVGSGRDKGALYAFAMEIPEVFWLEDQDAKHEAAQAVVDSLKKSPAMAAPGNKAQASDRGKFYDPSESETPIQIKKVI